MVFNCDRDKAVSLQSVRWHIRDGWAGRSPNGTGRNHVFGLLGCIPLRTIASHFGATGGAPESFFVLKRASRQPKRPAIGNLPSLSAVPFSGAAGYWLLIERG